MPQPTTTGGSLMGYPSTVDTGAVTPAVITNEFASYDGTLAQTLTANSVRLYAFELQVNVVVTGGRWHNGSTATGKTNVGIYTLAGALVSGSDSGQITNVASSDVSFTYTNPLSLSPGQYLLAAAASVGTDTYMGLAANAATAASRFRIATNALSAGVLPSTTGTLLTGANAFPSVSLIIQGGL